MPLVVPGITPQGGNDAKSDWMNKLMGKKIGDSTNETTFAKTELPKDSRVAKEGSVLSMEYKPDRMNVHTGEDGTVRKITYG